MRDLKNVSRGTMAVWGGEEEIQAERSTQVPVFLGAAHAYEDLDEWIDVSLGKRPGHIYGRNTNPTVQAFEEKVRLFEGAGAATSHVECTPEERKALGIPESLVRYSVGIEDVRDLIEDLTKALSKI